jgi:hypothetical protein
MVCLTVYQFQRVKRLKNLFLYNASAKMGPNQKFDMLHLLMVVLAVITAVLEVYLLGSTSKPEEPL